MNPNLIIPTARPTAKTVVVTRAIFFLSNRSVVWKRSTSGTPYFTQAFWNLKGEGKEDSSIICISIAAPHVITKTVTEKYRNSNWNFGIPIGIRPRTLCECKRKLNYTTEQVRRSATGTLHSAARILVIPRFGFVIFHFCAPVKK